MTEFGRICRACMCKEQNFHSILEFSEQTPLRICEMFATINPQIVIQPRMDRMPELICAVCLNKLKIAYNFQQMCITSDKNMRTMLTTTSAAQSHSKTPVTIEDALLSQPEDGDPLEGNKSLQLQEGFKVEINDEQVGSFDLVSLMNDGATDNQFAVGQDELSFEQNDACDSSQFSESEKTERECKDTKLRRGRSKFKDIPHTSTIHNETGLDEIEKPVASNRRNGNFPCPICGKDFDRPYRLRRHQGVHSLERAFECDICKYRFRTKNHWSTHKATHNGDVATKPIPAEGYKCLDCPRRFEKRESLSAHIQSHRKADLNQKFQCEFCPKIFSKFTLLSKHARSHPESQTFKCHLCVKTFAANSHLVEHLNKHNGLKPFVCVYCNKAFQQNGTLKEHQRTHTGDKPFLCPQCGKAFHNGSNMRQHLLRHSGEKRYQCPQCPSKFACQSDKIKHASTHRATKPHVCDICGSSFTRSYTLAKHKYIHTGERPHKCEECNMTFVFIDHMRRHMRTHTGEKPYKCPYCERSYAESGDRNKHLRSHVGENTYICDCKAAFKYQAELREHKIQHYKDELAKSQLAAKETETIDENKKLSACQ